LLIRKNLSLRRMFIMNMSHIIFGVACSMVLVTAVMSESEEPKKPTGGVQEERSFKKVVKKELRGDYLLYLPEDYNKDKGKRWPLVLHLHGIGERGDDVSRVKGHGLPRLVEEGRKFPFILVSPQCPERSWWESETDMLIALLDEIEVNYRVDKNRIYLMGLSMGGFGTWALAAKQPERFAAIAPICGGGDPKTAPLIKNIPMWVFHGEKDDVVDPAKSQEMVDAVKAAGGNPKFTLYPGVDHDAWDPTYANEEFWKWLLAQRKK
jgi:predicted peptidase